MHRSPVVSDLVRVGSLEIDQDVRYQELEWRIERIAWMLGALLLLAAAAGLFGSGPLSSTEAAAGPARLAYERFLRYGAPHRLRLSVETGDRDVLRIQLPREYLSHMRIDHVFPEPRRVVSRGDWVRCDIAVAPGSRAEIVFQLEPARRGVVRGSVRVAGERLRLWHFVYP